MRVTTYSDHELTLVYFTGQGLASLNIDTFRKHFQITAENEIIGDVSRVSLLNSVGKSFLSLPEIFGETGRPGNLVGKLLFPSSVTMSIANQIQTTYWLKRVEMS
jgi:hypothetical protein